MRTFSLCLIATAALAGCAAAPSGVPSLGVRPAEHQPILAPDAASEPDAPASPALSAALASLVADATAGHARFERERAATASVLARAAGAPEGSEAWIAGQQARSALDAAMTPVQTAAAGIDALRADPANAGPTARAAIDAAAAHVAALGDAEAATGPAS